MAPLLHLQLVSWNGMPMGQDTLAAVKTAVAESGETRTEDHEIRWELLWLPGPLNSQLKG